MKDNRKLEAFEENKRLIKRIDESIKKFDENVVIINRLKEELEEYIKEHQDEPKTTSLYHFDDLNEKRDELYKLTAERFNCLLESKGVNTKLYSLYKYDFANMDIFGDPYLNCTVDGLIESDCMPDMMICLLKIAERVCDAVDYKDFKLVKIRMDEECKNSDDDSYTFNLTFNSNGNCNDIIQVIFHNVCEAAYEEGEGIFIKNYAKLDIVDTRLSLVILPYYGTSNSKTGLSTFGDNEELDYDDDKTYDKIALAMKTNRENLADKFKLIINNLSV